MKRARDQLLSRSRLPGDQHSNVLGGYLLNLLLDTSDRLTIADETG